MLPERNWQGCFISYILRSWSDRSLVSVQLLRPKCISENPLKPSWFCIFGFPLFFPLSNRETLHYLVKILMPYFFYLPNICICGHVHPCGLLFQLLNRMNQYWVDSWRVGMQVTFGSHVVVLLVAVDVPKCTRFGCGPDYVPAGLQLLSWLSVVTLIINYYLLYWFCWKPDSQFTIKAELYGCGFSSLSPHPTQCRRQGLEL